MGSGMIAAIRLILLITCCAVLTACGESRGFDEGAMMRADVQRVQSDRCLIVITPMWGGHAYTARIEGCTR